MMVPTMASNLSPQGSVPRRNTAILDGRYQLVRRLHASEHGMLHFAIETRFNREVAIKTCDTASEGAERFPEIVRFLARLEHPNCVSVLDTGTLPEGLIYAVMPFVAGQRLRDVIGDGGIEPVRASAIAAAVLRGLAHVHRHGGVHRDLKPECIIVPPAEDAGARITDFWSAMVPALRQAAVSLADLEIGSAEYTSPEQAMGLAVDARSDLYAVGIMLFEMLHGVPPFRSEDPFEVLQLQIHSTLPQFGASVPTQLINVIVGLTAKNPDDRMTAEEALRDLDACTAAHSEPPPPRRMTPAQLSSTTGVTGATATPTMPYATQEIPRQRSQLAWGIGLGVLASMVVAAIAFWPRDTPTSDAPGGVADSAALAASPATPEGATPGLSKTLQSLALANERRLEHAAAFSQRHALVDELVAAGHGAKIDARVQLELDLLQAAQSTTPCATFVKAAEALRAIGDARAQELLSQARMPSDVPGAGVPPDTACIAAPAVPPPLAAEAAAPAAPEMVAAASPNPATAPRESRDRRGRGARPASKPGVSTPSAAVTPAPTEVPAEKPPKKPARAEPPHSVQKLDDDIKRL